MLRRAACHTRGQHGKDDKMGEQLHGFAGINGRFDFRDGNQRGLTLDSAIVVRWDGPKKQWVAVSGPGGEKLR